jgi:hypothetical protein
MGDESASETKYIVAGALRAASASSFNIDPGQCNLFCSMGTNTPA